MSYIKNCIEEYGGIIFNNEFDTKGNNIITITLQCMDSEDNLNKYYYIANGILSIEEYFKRNKYKVILKRDDILTNNSTITFIVNKDIKQWNRVYVNILNIMKKETKPLNVFIWKLNF